MTEKAVLMYAIFLEKFLVKNQSKITNNLDLKKYLNIIRNRNDELEAVHFGELNKNTNKSASIEIFAGYNPKGRILLRLHESIKINGDSKTFSYGKLSYSYNVKQDYTNGIEISEGKDIYFRIDYEEEFDDCHAHDKLDSKHLYYPTDIRLDIKHNINIVSFIIISLQFLASNKLHTSPIYETNNIYNEIIEKYKIMEA